MKTGTITFALMAVFFLLLLGACSDDRGPPEESVFQTQLEAIEKARQAQEKTREAADRTREALERAQAGME